MTAKVTQITLAIGATLNTGNYNNLRLDLTATVQMEEAQSQDAVVEMMALRLREELLSLIENVDADPRGIQAIEAIATKKVVTK